MRSWTMLAGIAGMLGAGAAGAQERDFGALPYDYLFANYALTELDSGGIEIGGSIEVADRVHVFGAYQDWELDNEFDLSAFHIGAGYRWALGPSMDVVAKLAYGDTEIDRPGPPPDLEDDGLILSGELRAWVAANIELSGELLLDDSRGSSTETVLEVGGRYRLNSNLSLGGRLRVDDDDTTLLLGARFYFGQSARRTTAPTAR